ncbi:hypothetical protein IAQ61_000050 [Plenodomus lingam]|nr:hypothetical protein IAQ61_000050 [Plenodomus lingam]
MQYRYRTYGHHRFCLRSLQTTKTTSPRHSKSSTTSRHATRTFSHRLGIRATPHLHHSRPTRALIATSSSPPFFQHSPHTPHTKSTNANMPSDLDQLVDMGFDRERATIALTVSGNLSGAIDWLDKNQEKSLDEIKAQRASASSAASSAPVAVDAFASEEAPALSAGEEAKSLVCDDCGRKLRSTTQAEWHASKTGHENFSQSTEEIAPLTEEEKKQRLEELKEKLALKRATQAEQEKEERKRNEQIRLKATKESQEIKEELQKKERLKEAQAKRAEKKADEEARKRVLAKLEADKQERKRKAELEKAARAGQAPPPAPAQAPLATSSGPTTSKPASAYTEARLALQTSQGRVMKTFPVETTLFEVAHALETEGVVVQTFTTNFPKKTYDKTDFGLTLKEAGMVPSAALIVG